jgi:precorrin-6A/cobalt-precorrin-6A reductase
MKTVFLIGGTAESKVILRELQNIPVKVIITVKTKYGKDILGIKESDKNVKVLIGKLTKIEIFNILKENKIKVLIDSSHPYADEITRNCIDTCVILGLRYIRYERDKLKTDYNKLRKFKSFYKCAMYLRDYKENILITVGSNKLEVFAGNISDFKNKIYIRVLPYSSILKKCENIGFSVDKIIAMKGPFSKEMNLNIFKDYNISTIVTKDGGKNDGINEKIEAARELGIEVILIERKKFDYEVVFNDIEKLIDYLVELIVKEL